MRIISGKFKGRRLQAPMKKWPTRPTTDFAKESLFNILLNNYDFPPAQALDLFAGTGNISFELLSRGCTKVQAVDKDRRCIRFIEEISSQLGTNEELSVAQSDVFAFLKYYSGEYDFVFADPPYDLSALPLLPQQVLTTKLMAPNGLFVLEHSNNHDFSETPYFVEVRAYGRTRFSFFEFK